MTSLTHHRCAGACGGAIWCLLSNLFVGHHRTLVNVSPTDEVSSIFSSGSTRHRPRARCSSVVRAFAHGAMGRRIDHSWGGPIELGARCSSVVRAFAHGAMGRRIDPSWGGPTGLFLVLASAPRLV